MSDMNYEETVEYLFNSTPLFQMVGAGAYKPGLENTLLLDEYFNHPHRSFRTIHVAGTNGKGSTASTLAAILEKAGYKTGLYTSPHLVDFRERIRIQGEMIPKDEVVDFVSSHRAFFEPLHCSFFELTTAMAFDCFRRAQVDVAVIEVGMGGRLDCTNIITPDLSIITNISLDHVQYLGDTLEKIAFEKAGIIKKDVPLVLGETLKETRSVFLDRAREAGSGKVYLAQEMEPSIKDVAFSLKGSYQEKNLRTILTAVDALREAGYDLKEEDVRYACMHVGQMTGLKGRWQVLSTHPLVVADAGHNTGGIRYVARQIMETGKERTHIVFGMVNDKDISGVLDLMPKACTYYFTKASVPRALDSTLLREKAISHGLRGDSYASVQEAVTSALENASKEDAVLIGGSCFVVADLLRAIEEGLLPTLSTDLEA